MMVFTDFYAFTEAVPKTSSQLKGMVVPIKKLLETCAQLNEQFSGNGVPVNVMLAIDPFSEVTITLDYYLVEDILSLKNF